MKKTIDKLLRSGKVKKHSTFEISGVVFGDCKKISGSAGSDVTGFYIYPGAPEGRQIEVVDENNVHYGYAHFNIMGNIVDNSNRSTFEIV